MTRKPRQHESVQAKPHFREKALNPQHRLSHWVSYRSSQQQRPPIDASSHAPINSHSWPWTLLFESSGIFSEADTSKTDGEDGSSFGISTGLGRCLGEGWRVRCGESRWVFGCWSQHFHQSSDLRKATSSL